MAMIVFAVAMLSGGNFFDKHQVTPSKNRGFAVLNISIIFMSILRLFCFTGSSIVALP